MASLNKIRLTGYVLKNPMIANLGIEGEEKAIFSIRTIRRDLDSYYGAQFQDVMIFYDGMEFMNKIKKIVQFDMVEIKGRYNEIMLKSFYENTSYQEDYIHITLTDEEDIVDAIGKLRTVYHNLMKLDYDNKRTRSVSRVDGAVDIETKTPIELFSDFYELQNNQPMSDEQKAFVEDLIEQVWEDEK